MIDISVTALALGEESDVGQASNRGRGGEKEVGGQGENDQRSEREVGRDTNDAGEKGGGRAKDVHLFGEREAKEHHQHEGGGGGESVSVRFLFVIVYDHYYF